MAVSRLLPLLCLALASAEVNYKNHQVSYKGHPVYRILVKDNTEADLLKSLEDESVYDFWSEIRVGKHVDVRTSPEDDEALKDWMKEKGLEYSVMIEDVEALMKLEKEPTAGGEVGKTMDWTSYHALEDIYEWFDYLEATFDFCEKEVIGQSHEGQDMIVMKVNQLKIVSIRFVTN